MSDAEVAIAAIGTLGTISAGFFALFRSQSQAHIALTKSFNANTKQLGRIATASERGNREAEKRNGHLADLIIQQGEATKTLADTATKSVIKAVQTVKEQHVEHQHVDQAELKKAVIKEKK